MRLCASLRLPLPDAFSCAERTARASCFAAPDKASSISAARCSATTGEAPLPELPAGTFGPWHHRDRYSRRADEPLLG